MGEDIANTGAVKALPRSLKDKILETELGQHWREIRWWTRQFTPVSTTVLGIVLSAAGTWIVSLSHKVDTQGTKIDVLDSQVLPYMHAKVEEAGLREKIDGIDTRVKRIESNFDLDLAEKLRAAREAEIAARKGAKERPKR